MRTHILLVLFILFFPLNTYSFENKYDQVEEKLETNRFEHLKEKSLEYLEDANVINSLEFAQKYIDRTYLECDGYKLFSDIYKISKEIKKSNIYNMAYIACEETNLSSTETLRFISNTEDIIDKNIYIIKNYFSIRKNGKFLEVSLEKYNNEPGYVFLHILPVLESKKTSDFYAQVRETDFVHKPLFLQYLYELNPVRENLYTIGQIFEFEELFFNRSWDWYKSTYHSAYAKLYTNIGKWDDKMYYGSKFIKYEDESSKKEYKQILITYLFEKVKDNEDYTHLYSFLDDSISKNIVLFLWTYLDFLWEEDKLIHNMNVLYELIGEEDISKYISRENLNSILNEHIKNINCDVLIIQKEFLENIELFPTHCYKRNSIEIVKDVIKENEDGDYIEKESTHRNMNSIYILLMFLWGVIALFLLFKRK